MSQIKKSEFEMSELNEPTKWRNMSCRNLSWLNDNQMKVAEFNKLYVLINYTNSEECNEEAWGS